MPRSANGWLASPSKADVHLTALVVDGVGFLPGVRGGDVHTVLGYVAQQVNDRVEKAHNPGCWGWSYRANRNSPNSLSNHSSATAIDYNAPRHPNGVRTTRTWSAKQIAEIHKILDEVDHVVRWGGDYTHTPDAMHFEINGDAAAVGKVAAKITAGTLKTPVSTGVTPGGVNVTRCRAQFVAAGHHRDVTALPGVARIQQALNTKHGARLVVDGYVGPQTLATVSEATGTPYPTRAGLEQLLKGTPYFVTPKTAAPGPAPAPAPKPNPVHVAPSHRGGKLTWVSRQANVQGTDPLQSVQADITRLMRGATILRLNELHTEAQQEYTRTRPGWASVVHGQLAIMYDARVWKPVTSTYEPTNGGVNHITPPRGILSLLLEHRATRKRHWEQVTHVVHHIEVGGRARVRGALSGQNRRARHHFRMLAASIVAHATGGKVNGKRVTSAPVTGSGDLNVDYRAEKNLPPSRRTAWFPYDVLGAVAKPVMPYAKGHLVGTHGGRAIDWGWRRGAITVTKCRTLPRGTSDHNPVTYTTVQP